MNLSRRASGQARLHPYNRPRLEEQEVRSIQEECTYTGTCTVRTSIGMKNYQKVLKNFLHFFLLPVKPLARKM